MSYNLVDPTTGELTQVAGGIDTSIIPSDASASNKLATQSDLMYIPIKTDRTITFSNDYTEISVCRGGYNSIKARIEIAALCKITSINGWIGDMGIVLPERYRPSYETTIPCWGNSDTESHIPIILILGTNGKFSGYMGGSHKSITQFHIAVTYFK